MAFWSVRVEQDGEGQGENGFDLVGAGRQFEPFRQQGEAATTLIGAKSLN